MNRMSGVHLLRVDNKLSSIDPLRDADEEDDAAL